MASELQGPPTVTQADPPLGRGGAALLLATVFASGAAVMILEMTAVRAVQPYFGSTTVVWTNVIAVVLAALALGYALGGRLADRRPSWGLLYGLLGAGGLLVALTAWLVTPVSGLFLEAGVDLEGVVSVLLWGSLGTALVLFAPPILLLGTVAPIAIRLLARRGLGRAVGSVFALSTLGSILGTYLPTLVLVPRIGSRGSILVAAGILLVASAAGLLTSGPRRGRRVAPALLLAAALALGAAAAGLVPPGRPAPRLDGGVATLLAEAESPYQYLTVREDVWPDGTERVLTINEGLYTWHALRVDDRVLSGSRYHDAYAVLPFLLDLEVGAALDLCVVGLACGVNAVQWHHFFSAPFDLHVDGAELDPAVVRLGRRYFDLPDEAPWLRVHTLDGRSLLERVPAEKRYDTIILDAFANELYVPFHLATREFFALCERRLERGGLLAMNVYARGADAPNLLAIENTMTAVFPTVLRVPHDEAGGYLLLARRGEAPIEVERLAPDAIHERFASWAGFTRWRETQEWSDLLALADAIRRTVRRAEHAPRHDPDHLVLTDDHAPLEWLTDRFLSRSEAELLAAGDDRSLALAALRARQGRLLLGIGLAWAGLLAAAGLLARAGSQPPRPDPEAAQPPSGASRR